VSKVDVERPYFVSRSWRCVQWGSQDFGAVKDTFTPRFEIKRYLNDKRHLKYHTVPKYVQLNFEGRRALGSAVVGDKAILGNVTLPKLSRIPPAPRRLRGWQLNNHDDKPVEISGEYLNNLVRPVQ